MHHLMLGAGLIVFWLLLSGYFTNPLLLFFGLVSVTFTLYLEYRIHRRYALNTRASMLKKLPGYFRWLVFEVIKANIAVIKNIWMPLTHPINPKVEQLIMRQKTALGRTIFANSITLTPGTVSFDVNDNKVKVHAIVEEAIVELQDGEMNQRVADLEEENP